MAAPRFFCPVQLHAHQTLTLPPDLAHYALRVLRLKDGAEIILFDGSGGQFDAVIRVSGKSAEADVGAHHAIDAELPGRITLVQGLPSGDKMDWIVEKAVEMGAYRLVPITAQRSVVQLNAERRAKRMKHWQRVAQSASEQCGRNRIMQIAEPVTLEAYLEADTTPGPTLLCHPEAEQGLAQVLDNRPDLTLLVGPEGGWSPEEQQTAVRHGAKPLRFGTRVLRTETAGIALIAAISALNGWL
ncbi:16S rRNA (uracil(1498)-N(3))-methyltransferase [Pusillimonas sp.]|uniref:16S rRNA (uracil(1498)-N(3))-methyltransferase n=1 Tax=Pusillimonas sp. TaxID=3040095 RepID=UPI0037C98701